MNVKMVRYKVGIVLDQALHDDLILRRREPPLPAENQDRTDWLLWCTERYKCTMDEANKRYWRERAQITLLAKKLKRKRKP